MQERHRNSDVYIQETAFTLKKHIIPFISQVMEITPETSILEVGSGLGGNLLPFVEMGCKKIVGIDLFESFVNLAKEFYSKHPNGQNVTFINKNIHEVEDIGQFDLIICKDVLEHIYGQEEYMHHIKKFMKPTGKFFLGFPPWHNPFGGHQQIAKSKFLSRLPFFHILPKRLYKGILTTFKEPDSIVRELISVKETSITIERFERILKKENYHIDLRCFYFINPHYEIKFGLKPRKSWKWIASIPYLRGFFITTNYYVISKQEDNKALTN